MALYDKFYEKKFQKLHGFPPGAPTFDYHYEKTYYGRVDREQNSVIIKDEDYLDQISPKEPHMALDFVARAYIEFEKHITKALALEKIHSRGSPFVKNMKIKGGYTSPKNLYKHHIMNDVYSGLAAFLTSPERNKKVRNFRDFVFFFYEFVRYYGHLTPITVSGFLKSNLCPRNVSGLIIELGPKSGTYSYGDTEHINTVIEDTNFDFYRNAAAKFGFYLDESAPWCLVANVSSIEMQNNWVFRQNPTPSQIGEGKKQGLSDGQIIEKYTKMVSERGLFWKPGDASNLFDVYYERSYKFEAEVFLDLILMLYKKFVEQFPKVREHSYIPMWKAIKCKTHKVTEFTREPPPTQENLPDELIPILFSSYLQSRLNEERVKLKKSKFQSIIKISLHLNKKQVDISEVLKYINKQVLNYKSLVTKENTFFPEDERMNLDCQNFQTCGVKKVEQKKYNKYVPEPLI